MSEIELFNKYKYEFDLYQRYIETDYWYNKSLEQYKNIRREFLKYKKYYEEKTKDYRKNSSYIILGKDSYEFIIPKKFNELMQKTNILDNERRIINGSYIGSTFSWNLNSKLRKGEKLTEAELLVKKTLHNVINKNTTSENYICKKYIHDDYIEKNFGIYPSKLNDKELERQLDCHVGEIVEEKGFMSCSMTDSHVISGEGVLNIYVHSGTRAFITDNINETEIIFDCGTKYVLMNYVVNSQSKTRIILNVLIIRI